MPCKELQHRGMDEDEELCLASEVRILSLHLFGSYFLVSPSKFFMK